MEWTITARLGVFDLKELLDELVPGAGIGDLFVVASDFFLEQKRKKSKQAAVVSWKLGQDFAVSF